MTKHRSSQFKVLVTEDLTKPMRKLFHQLNIASQNKNIVPFGIVDGKIFYKESETDLKVHVKDLKQINHRVPDPVKMVQNQWNA